jgi:hypothetical protein
MPSGKDSGGRRFPNTAIRSEVPPGQPSDFDQQMGLDGPKPAAGGLNEARKVPTPPAGLKNVAIGILRGPQESNARAPCGGHRDRRDDGPVRQEPGFRICIIIRRMLF